MKTCKECSEFIEEQNLCACPINARINACDRHEYLSTNKDIQACFFFMPIAKNKHYHHSIKISETI